jgi:ATP-dependent DNA ligase
VRISAAAGYRGAMSLPVRPPVAPMLARLARELPVDGYVYEPKWDGFRCLAFRDGRDVELRSRNDRPLGRYFPELREALAALPEARFVLDGEIVLPAGSHFDFPALLERLHPARTRVERLRAERPASLIAFDLLALGEDDLRRRPFVERRAALERLLAHAQPPLRLTPATGDARSAEVWLDAYQGRGIDGVVAKHETLPYEEGARRMVKVKHARTADCVVAGFRRFVDRPLPSSLLLGLFDAEDELRHVGIASSFGRRLQQELLDVLRPLVAPLAGHPWERGFLLAGGATGRLRGSAGRWSPDEMSQDWTPVRPELVCEVAYDQLDDRRFRHPGRFRRWRPDRDPHDCRIEQLDAPVADLRQLLPGG